jgi:uncharacterized protein (DUF885 family)
VRIPNLLTVVHPVRTEADARNYVARLREVDDRMAEASEEAARLVAKGIRPPRFILQSTISQMQQFAGSPAGQNPLVATFVERMNGVQALTASAAATTERRSDEGRRKRSLSSMAQGHLRCSRRS